VQRRIAELSASGERRAKVDARSLIEKAEPLIEGATEAGQFGPVGKAIELQGKLGGALVDRLEVGGPGAFSAAQSLEEIALALLSDVPIDEALGHLEGLREALIKAASNRAVVVEEPRRGIPVDELAASLAAVRKASHQSTLVAINTLAFCS
jgi:hypothetical protein